MHDALLTMMLQAAPGKADDIRRLHDLSPCFRRLMHDATEQECRRIFRDPGMLPDGSDAWLPAMTDDDVGTCMRALRLAKHHGMRHVIWWELGLHGDIEQSARHLAWWAGGLLQSALATTGRLLRPRFGEIADGRFSIIGLGKLGGMELNLGSDVDLLFIWDAPAGARSRGGRRDIDAREYYQHFSRMLIRLMSEHTADGMAWLVDMRLRPGGDSAPICMSLDATLDYYQDYGQTWERAMLLKARPVAGDMVLGRRFLDGVAPFVYRRYLDYTTVQALADMKRRIDERGGRDEPAGGFDVKRGRGGIREIEFFVQSLQLLHGGRDERLRVQPCMAALTALTAAGIVPMEDGDRLAGAYWFWRRVEHALQARNGEHTHRLPQDYADYLGAVLGLGDPDRAMREQAACVHACFAAQFADFESKEGGGEAWLELEGPALAARLDGLDDAGRQRVTAALRRIATLLRRSLLPERAHAQVEHILAHAMQSWLDDANGVQALEYFAELLQHISGRATWVDMLAGNRSVLNWLIDMLAASRYIAGHVSQNPTWLEWVLESERGEDRMRKIHAAIGDLDAQQMDEGDFLAELGRLTDQARLTTAMAIISDGTDPLQAGKWLAETADAATQAAMRLALRQFGLGGDFPFVCLAMGKHGSREMGLLSDMDMVFVLVHDEPASIGVKGKSLRDWAQRIGRRVIQFLSMQPPYGAGYRFDARLRPSGSAGVLVTTLEGFRDYQMYKAQAWEHQALCRARPVAGPGPACRQVDEIVRQVLAAPRDRKVLAGEVLAMRRRMMSHLGSHDAAIINLKQDAGGLVDIEFLAQYARLAFGGEHAGTVETLRHLPDSAPPPWQDAAMALADTYVDYRRMENALRVQLWQSIGKLPADDAASEWETLRRHAPVKSVAALRRCMRQTHETFLQLLEGEKE